MSRVIGLAVVWLVSSNAHADSWLGQLPKLELSSQQLYGERANYEQVRQVVQKLADLGLLPMSCVLSGQPEDEQGNIWVLYHPNAAFDNIEAVGRVVVRVWGGKPQPTYLVLAREVLERTELAQVSVSCLNSLFGKVTDDQGAVAGFARSDTTMSSQYKGGEVTAYKRADGMLVHITAIPQARQQMVAMKVFKAPPDRKGESAGDAL